MKLACVIQRYGDGIIGGAELHCRLVAEHLAARHTVEILTTCAADYLTWKNVFQPGTTSVGGLPVTRFLVDRSRPTDFDALAHRTLFGYPSMAEQHEYLHAHGPVCPDLITSLRSRSDIDRFILFSYRYWTTHTAAQIIGDRAILVPTAEHDRTLYLDIHRSTFHRCAAIAFNSPEERRLIRSVTGNSPVPGMTVGVGLPETAPADDADLREWDLHEPYMVYIGRIEEAKGCAGLIGDYLDLCRVMPAPPRLVFIGKQEIPIPAHPRIFNLGVVPEDIKLAILRRALALVMPSRYESLSMVVLEAWRMGRPVVCNAACDVLRGQCVRSGGGLYYRNTDEFIETVSLLAAQPALADAMGAQGCVYTETRYAWPVIMGKYDRLLAGEGDAE